MDPALAAARAAEIAAHEARFRYFATEVRLRDAQMCRVIARGDLGPPLPRGGDLGALAAAANAAAAAALAPLAGALPALDVEREDAVPPANEEWGAFVARATREDECVAYSMMLCDGARGLAAAYLGARRRLLTDVQYYHSVRRAFVLNTLKGNGPLVDLLARTRNGLLRRCMAAVDAMRASVADAAAAKVVFV